MVIVVNIARIDPRLPLRVQTDDRLWCDAGFLSGPGETAIRLVQLSGAFAAESPQRPRSLSTLASCAKAGRCPGLRVFFEGDAVANQNARVRYCVMAL